MRRRPAVVLAIVCGLVTASCSTETPGSRTPNTSTALAARVQSLCSDVSAPDLGEGTVCIDNGFRLERDDFSFANWGRSTRADDNVTTQTLIDLFGHDTVCIPGDRSECVMRPPAVQLLERWNTALSGGRCEGLAALSARMYMALEHPQSYSRSAARVSDLSARDPEVAGSLVYWWATQFLDEVARSAENSRRKSPLVLVEELIQGLARSLGHTLGMYYGNQGHAVTPFAVTRRGGDFVIHVYDNNFPGKRREVLVNMATNSWLYLGATESVDGSPVDWAGTTGTLELTSMSARQGPFTCPFCTAMTDESPTVITLSSRDGQNPGFLHVKTGSGSFVVTPQRITNTIDGATFTVGKGNRGLISVQIPPSVSSFDVSVRRETDDVPAGDVVLSVERNGFARLQMSGDLAVADLASVPVPVVSAERSKLTVLAPPQSRVAVTAARLGTLASHSLAPDESVSFSRVNDRSITVSVKGAAGATELELPVAPADTSERVVIAPDGNGALLLQTTNPTAVTARPQRNVNFTPGKKPRRAPTVTTVPSIEISDPD